MPTIVQTFQGKVTGIWGTAAIRGVDGKMHVLKVGDLVHKGDVILTSQDGIVQLSLDGAPSAAAVAATEAASAPATAANAPATTADIDRVISGLDDPNSQAATAAGVTGGDGAGDLTPGLRVDRIAESTSPANLGQPGDDASRPIPPRTGGELDNQQQQPQPAQIGADSKTIDATEEGPAVNLGLDAPTGVTNAAVITVTEIPSIGQLLKADGTPVAAGSVLTAAELAGLKYLPPADYNGSAPVGEFTYTVTDQGVTVGGAVQIDLGTVNDAPVANADVVATLEDTPLTGNVLTNDTDADGDTLRVTQYTIAGVAHTAGSTTALAGIGTLVVNADGSYTFTPAPDYNGPVPTIGYTVSDGTTTASSTLTISVTAVNDAPEAANDIASTPINTPVTIPVLANDHDRDGDPLTVTSATLSNPAQGTLVVNPDGTLSFTPATNSAGPVTITYTVSDGHGGTDTATVTVNVGANTPPTGADATRSFAEDTSYTVQTGDFGFADADAGQTLANVRIDTLPGAGTLLLNGSPVVAGTVVSAADIAAGHLVFVPAADGNGAPYAQIGFSVQDSAGAFDPTPNTLSLNVTPVNDAPIAHADAATVIEDTPATGNVLANDTDVDGDTLHVTQFVIGGTTYAAGATATLAGIGTLQINDDGSYTFNPAANYNGPVPLATYTATDGTATSSATLTLSVTPVNDAPVAVNDLASTPINTPITIAVLANDTDAEHDPLTVTTATLADPSQGTLTINPDGTLSFTPANNLSGSVGISYTISDGNGGTSTATVTVNVGTNTPPTGADSIHTIAEDTSYTVQTADLGFADTDAGQTLANVRIDTLPAAGTLLLNGSAVTAGTVVSAADIAAGHLVFVPAADGNGSPYASFGFSVQDSAGAYDAAPNTLTLNVTPVNDAPVANPDVASVSEDTPATGNVLTNDTDVDGDALHVTQFVIGGTTYAAGATATLAGVGTLQINADGSYNFNPAANYNGTVPVATYTVSDGSLTATSTLTLNVTAVNDAPVANPDTATLNEDTPLVVNAAAGLLANDTDVDGDALHVTQFAINGTTYAAGATAALAGVGSLQINADGSYSFTPAANYNGAVPVATYTVSDGSLTSSSTLTLNVTPVNDAPVAVNDTASTAINTPLANIAVLGNDSDVDGDTLTVTSATLVNPALGTVTINPNGTLNFTPASNVSGDVAINYAISDGHGGVANAVLTVSVGANTPPAGTDETVTIDEDTSKTFSTGDFGYVDADAGQSLANVRIDTLPGAGTLALNGVAVAAGQVIAAADLTHLVFTPVANANGTGYAAFTFSVQDSAGAFDPTPNTVTINVTPVNDAPVAVNDLASATEAGGVGNATAGVNPTGNVLANDTDVDVGDTKNVSAISGVAAGTVGGATAGQYGSLTIDANGNYTYTVDNSSAAVQSLRTAGDTLTDTFTYTVRDAAGATSTATLTVTIHGANDAPVAVADTANATEDAILNVAAAGVLANDTDVDAGDTKTVSAVSFNGTAGTVGSALDGTYGKLTLNADGSYAYLADKPAADALAAGQTATEQFTYTMTDASGATSTSTLTITVTGVNDAPVANPDTHSTNEDTPLVVNAANGVLSNDTDVDAGSSLHVTQFVVGGTTYAAGTAATLAGAGTLQINADGSYSFTPVANYNGAVPVATYTVSDGTASSTSTLSLTVNPVNDAPVLSLDADHSHNTVVVQAISGLFNTGESNAGTALASGTADPHYTLLSAPAGSTLAATALGYGSWLANDADSTWIGSSGNQPTGVYQYQTSFTLQTGADPSSVQIAFDVASDNNLRDILVNGVSTGFSSNVQYTAFTHVQLAGVTSAFTSGVNTITFVVDNRDPGSPGASGPTGLRIDNMTGNVAVIVPDASGHQGDYATTYIEGTPVSIGDSGTSAVGVSVSDVDSPNMQSAVITLTNPQAGDVLQLGALPAGVTASINAAGTVITLSGSAPQASYEAAIRAVQFNNTTDNPSGAIDRTVTVVVNDGQLNSNTATTTIHVVPVDDAPVLDLDGNNSSGATGTGYNGSYTENGASVRIVDTDVAITDSDSTTLRSAQVHITNLQPGDVLTVGALPAGISAAVYDPTTGVLTLSGTGTLAAYQTALGAIRFSNTTDSPGATTRNIEITVNDGLANSNVAISHISVTPVNDAPAGTDKTITTLEDTAYTLARGDFGFTDPLDAPAANNFASVVVNPTTAGTLTLNGVTVTAATTVTVAQLDAGLLKFTPATDANGSAYTTLKFQVKDDGGTANGGVDTDQSPNTITFNVTAVNDAPAGTNKTVTTLEDTAYTLTRTDFGFTDTHDAPANNFASVIVNPSSAGTLTLNGVTITAATTVSVAQLDSGLLKFTPATDANGAANATLNFQVKDDGGTANGGVDTDQSPNTITFNVTAVNDAPAGTNKTVTAVEDTAYTLARADFGFTDTHDTPANNFASVTVNPTSAGTLTLNGVLVTAATVVTVAQLDGGLLKFTPAADASGSGYASLNFQVKDDGGVANGGVDTDQSPNTITFNVTAVNDAPAGTNKTIATLEDTAYTVVRSDFGFSDTHDTPANNFASVIVNPSSAGTLSLNGITITAATTVTVAQLDAGLLKFNPALNANGNGYASVNFQVKDDGGTANGGVDTDPSPNTLTFDVTPVNDPAVIAGQTSGATVEDTTLTSTGTLTIVDPDTGEAAFVAQNNVAGAHGTFSIDSAGHWTYTLNNADPAVQALGQGQTLPNEVFAVHSIDGTAANVTVSITGINDAPVAHADTIITNVAAGQNINIATGALTLNDTDIDAGTVLTIASSSNAQYGSVSGTSPVVFKDTVSFGAIAQSQAESAIFPGDSEANPLNNSMATAYLIDRSRFGIVSAADAPYLGYPDEPSFKWTGRIDDQSGTPNATDQDYLKVYLHAGERITLDIDGADNGGTDIGTNPDTVDMYLQLFDANGNKVAENDDASPSLGGLGSVGSGFHPAQSLDSYLEYTVTTDGYYYVNATAFNNNGVGIVQDDGNYTLWLSIKPTAIPPLPSFDYTATDGLANSTAHATVTTVQGSTLTGTSADEILIGGNGNDTINGGGGHNWIQGGAGSDTMTGGNGADVFAWTLADRGSAGSPPTDTITDFSVAAPSSGGDVLDLRDLLQGEAKSGTDAGNLQNYLDFDTTSTPGSTIIHISSTGGFTNGTFNAAAEDQRIVLQGVDLRSPAAFGLQASATDNDVIHQLLQRGKLVADGG